MELEVPFDGTGLEGRTVAIEAGISRDGIDVATRTDLDDPAARIYLPKVCETRVVTGAGFDELAADAVTEVEAEVAFQGLPSGSYAVSVELVDLETLDVVEGLAMPEASLASDGREDSVTLRGSIDATGLAGHTLSTVACLKSNGSVVATECGGATLSVPAAHGDLHDAQSHSTICLAGEDTTLEGTVSYQAVTPGSEHVVRGTLLDARTGREVVGADGKPATATATFVPPTSEGVASVTFLLDAHGFEGRSLCASFELVRDGYVVATCDSSDGDAEPLAFPSLRATATSEASGDHELPADGSQAILCDLAFGNVLAGRSYELDVRLIDAETGEDIGNGDGDMRLTSTVDAEDTDGSERQ